jgi:TolA-binding protein
VIPEALFRLGEVYSGDGRAEDSQRMYRQLADEYPYTEWGKRAAQRLQAATR